jgi:hypothetical protein
MSTRNCGDDNSRRLPTNTWHYRQGFDAFCEEIPALDFHLSPRKPKNNLSRPNPQDQIHPIGPCATLARLSSIPLTNRSRVIGLMKQKPNEQ